jgi:regulation of enolase protein 1 (concanavalin A-like superfamily)
MIGGQSITCPAGTVGFNAIRLTCDPLDDHGHGTAMAGIIGAEGNNSFGVSGVAWTTSVMALKFIGPDGVGSYADAINAIAFAVQVRDRFAASGGAELRVLSNSWTGEAFSQALLDAVELANSRDLLVVASAGNDGRDNDTRPMYPASLPAANILSVLATGAADGLEHYTNFGVTSVDVGAPGLTYSTTFGGGYGLTFGTSVATAFASGAASLVLSRCGLTVSQLKSTLLESADPIEALRFVSVSGGRIHLRRALDLCAGDNNAPSIVITSPSHSSTFTEGSSITLSADAFDPDGLVTRVDFYTGPSWIGRATTSPFEISIGSLPAGMYEVTAVATDDRGATSMTLPLTFAVGGAQILPPSPWRFDDVGATGTAGHVAFEGGAVMVQGSGADIWGTSDAFTFVHRRLDGDGEIVARVVSVEAVDPWTKAGVMIRSELAPGDAHAFMLVSAERGLAFQRRTASGGATLHTSGGAGSAPQWVKLARQGTAVTASVSADGVSWTVVGSDAIDWGPSVYVGLAVTSHEAGRSATARFDSISITASPASSGLPDGWAHGDVGEVGVAGRATEREGSFTVTGAGRDVWGAADEFQFVYRPMQGDGQIVARLASLDGEVSWAKAGLMIRESLDPSSAHAFVLASLSNGIAFQRRAQAGALTAHTGTEGGAPVWLRLTRVGSAIAASISADGASWTVIGEDSVPLGATVMVGLAVSSHDPATTATAVFDNISVVSSTLPPGWESADIGTVGASGSAAGSGWTFAVAGAGADVWRGEDAFHFAYTPLHGSGSIVARVASIEHVHAWTKAGVMVRQSLDAMSSHAFMLVSGGHGLAFQYRLDRGWSTGSTPAGDGAAPQWVKLTRNDSTIVAETSADGVAWTIVGSQALALQGSAYAGLAVASHDPLRPAIVLFTDVQVSQ